MDSENEEVSSWKGVPATVICINIYDPGQLKTGEMAHAATCRMIRQYLRLSSSHFVGVCFYGMENSTSSVFGIKSVQEVFPLTLPTLDNFKKLQNINVPSLNQAKELVLSDVLWHCSKTFASCKRQLSSRNVIILSRYDIPPLQSDQKPAFKRVVDLVDSNIDIRLINISETNYDIDTFYENFLIEANKKEDIELPKPVWGIKEIEMLIHQQSHRHLAVAKLNFEIGDGLSIGVGLYNLLKGYGQTEQKKTNLDRETNAVLTSVNKTTKINVVDDSNMDTEDTQDDKSMPVLKSELLYYQTYGEEKITFTDDEMKTLKNPFGPPMLKLLGFKPASIMCKEKWFLKPCYFLFPNESIIEGSFVAFKALYQACIETNMVAICLLCTRVNSRPMIVALSPSHMPLDLSIDTGFDIIRVPFIENVRNIPVNEDEDILPSDVNKTVMKDILNSLQFDYKPGMFENPKLQSQYRAIEAIALEDEEVDPFIDTTKPDSKKFHELKDDLFQELFGPFGAMAIKKPSTSRNGGPPSKKNKS